MLRSIHIHIHGTQVSVGTTAAVPSLPYPFIIIQVIARGHDVTNDNVIVSAPGRNGERGSVHVYTYVEGAAAWGLTQTVTGELWSLGELSLHKITMY